MYTMMSGLDTCTSRVNSRERDREEREREQRQGHQVQVQVWEHLNGDHLLPPPAMAVEDDQSGSRVSFHLEGHSDGDKN